MISILSSELSNMVSYATHYVEKDHRSETRFDKGPIGIFLDEPSTRTRFSTASAAARLGLTPIICDDLGATSLSKGEGIADTAAVISNYFDLVAIRSRYAGLPELVARHATVPVVNLGDGAHEHPQQIMPPAPL